MLFKGGGGGASEAMIWEEVRAGVMDPHAPHSPRVPVRIITKAELVGTYERLPPGGTMRLR
jgi:hypothetical protein